MLARTLCRCRSPGITMTSVLFFQALMYGRYDQSIPTVFLLIYMFLPLYNGPSHHWINCPPHPSPGYRVLRSLLCSSAFAPKQTSAVLRTPRVLHCPVRVCLSWKCRNSRTQFLCAVFCASHIDITTFLRARLQASTTVGNRSQTTRRTTSKKTYGRRVACLPPA